jgi:Ricin-type beta-trefoil lectin domain
VDGAGQRAGRATPGGCGGSSPWRALRVRAALVSAGVTGLALTALPAIPASAGSAARPASAAAIDGGSALASAQFVARPQVAPAGSGLRQGCATPAMPGQMACMVLIRRGARLAGPDAGSPDGYTPQDLQGAYGLTAAAAKPGGGETIAVVDAFNDANAASDLAQYRAKFGLPACTTASGCLTIMNEHGGTKLPKSDSSGGWELEESLDLDMVSAICPNCSIVLLEADSASISDLATAERTASRVPGVDAVSNSWGSGAEFIGENQFDQDFYAPGVAIVAAGGDDGYGTQYPAVSPYVTAAGGTSLLGSGSSWTQTAWSGVGSGCSSLEPKPPWQTEDDRSPDGCLNRTINDVSADADPSPGVAIYDTIKDSGIGGVPGWTSVGGTSVATAIIAATYALADIVAGGPHSGLISGTFPASYPYRATSGLTDVTGGSNGTCESYRQYLCNGVTGYDGPTGLGTPAGTSAFTAKLADEVTVADPGTLVVAGGAKLYMALNYEPGTEAPTFSTTPASLPGSLYVDGYGFLRGTAPTKPGVYPITVSAAVSGVGTGSTSFTLVVVPAMRAAHPGRGEVRLDGGNDCLTVTGSRARIESCAGHSDQQWELVPGGSLAGTGQLKNRGRCLAVGAGTGAGADVQKCGKSTRQQWTYQGSDRFRNEAASLCLAIRGTATAGKQPVDWACGPASSWQLPAAPVLSAVAGRCLNDPGARSASGTRIQVAACTSGSGQRWVSERNQTLEIAGKCVTVTGSSLLDGAAIVLARCTEKLPQQWLRGPNGELMNANSGRCLADPSNSTRSGTALVQEDCYSLPGEIWTVS